MLEDYIRNKQKEKDILLMAHVVLGYPSQLTWMGAGL